MQQLQFDLFDDNIKYEPTQYEIDYTKAICVKHIFEEHLLKFNIEEIYEKKVKGNNMLCRKIEELFNDDEHYEEYYNEFYNLCIKYFKHVNDSDFQFGISIYRNIIRIHTEKMIGPAYCLSMLPLNIFMYGLKEEWK